MPAQAGDTMRSSRVSLPQHSTNRRRRAAVLLEFVFTLPFTLIFLMMIIDIGRMYLAAGALNESTWRAARAAAVAGGADIAASGASQSTPGGTVPTVLDDAFHRSLAENQAGENIDAATIVALQPSCSSASDIIRVTAKASIPTLTPGLGVLLGVGENGDWGVSVAAVAQCETAG